MNKNVITKTITILMVICMIVALAACGNKEMSNDKQSECVEITESLPDNLPSEYQSTLNADSSELMPDIMNKLESELGEEFKSDVKLTDDEMLNILGLDKNDCIRIVGYIEADGNGNHLIGINFAEECGDKVHNALIDYVDQKNNRADISEKEAIAWRNVMMYYNPDGYIYLSAILDGIDALPKEQVAEYIEKKNLEAIDIIANMIGDQYN